MIDNTIEPILLNSIIYKKVKRDLIKIESLLPYGFDDEVLEGLKEYKIMPSIYVFEECYYFRRSDITKLLNTFLHNEITMYKRYKDFRTYQKELIEELKGKCVDISPDVLERVEKGEDITKVLEEKLEEIKNKDEE